MRGETTAAAIRRTTGSDTGKPRRGLLGIGNTDSSEDVPVPARFV
jgi:hypothetical protein